VPRIVDELMKSIVYLFPTWEDAEAGSDQGATGFIALEPFAELPYPSEQGQLYVVTNRHVIGQDCHFVRSNSSDGVGRITHIPLRDWHTHMDDDDLAVAEFFEEAGDDIFPIRSDRWLLDPSDVAEINLGVGDEVYMLGRFHTGTQARMSTPVARFGNISRMPSRDQLVVDGRQFGVEAFLVDMRSVSGFSGSPTFVIVEADSFRGFGHKIDTEDRGRGWLALIGVDTGHFMRRLSVLEDNSLVPAEAKAWVDAGDGLAIVSPAWRLRLLLDDEYLTERREKIRQQLANDYLAPFENGAE
jgi:hypothetical protein